MTAPLTVEFLAGSEGPWRIASISARAGEGLPAAGRLAMREGTAGEASASPRGGWRLRGVAGHLRYTTRSEATDLAARQEGLGRPQARLATLIPIRKCAAWWSLAQDERRAIMEARSKHIAIGREYLPAIARRLHHARDLGEPFDFLTWFEYAPEHATAFEDMLARLRTTEAWRYVDREVDIRLAREPADVG